MQRFSGLIWSLARRFSPTLEDAEDAVQEIFLDLWKSAGRYDAEMASELTFVAMIARRRLIDRRRRAGRTPISDGLAEPEEIAAEDERDDVAIADEADRVGEALSTLRREQREVIEMSLLHGRTHREIAEDTGMPLGTVKSLARRGLIRVREMLRVSSANPEATP